MKTFLILIFSFLVFELHAQSVNKIDKLQVNDLVTKKLEVQSTVIGSIPCPSMSQVQMEAIALPLAGSCVFNTGTDTLQVYDGSAWVEVGSGSGGISSWETAKFYDIGAVVIESLKIYQANTAHTSTVFATDIANWTLISGVTLGDATGLLDAIKIGTGDVSNTEFNYLNNVTSAIQTQLDGKEPTITVLPLAKGGTNKNMTASAGSVLYSDADSQELTSVGTAGQILQSNGASAPTFVNKSISVKAQSASSVSVEEIQAPANQLTQTATNKHLLETGNTNLLINPGFEHSTPDTGWTTSCTGNATAAFVASTGTSPYPGENQYGSFTVSFTGAGGGTCSLKQEVTTVSGVQGLISVLHRAYGGAAAGITFAKLHTLVNGARVTTKDITNFVGATNTQWSDDFTVPEVSTGTSMGVELEVSSTSSFGSYGASLERASIRLGNASVMSPIITPWVSYTPTVVGLGAPTGVECWHRQNGSSRDVRCRMVSGTSTAVPLTVSLPSGDVIAASSSSASILGFAGIGFLGANSVSVLGLSGESVFKFGIAVTGTSNVNVANGNGILSSGQVLSFSVSVPVANLSGSTQVFASQCGAGCENVLSASVTSAGVVSKENVDWINGNFVVSNTSTYTGTFNTGIFTVAPNCVFITNSGSNLNGFQDVATSATTVVPRFMNTGGVNTASGFDIVCQKQGADYQSSRTIVGSFKEVPKVVGINSPKECRYKFGGASATLAAPTECTSGTCVEVEDSCATGSPPAYISTGRVGPLVFASGTFANSSPLHCDCVAFDTTTGTEKQCDVIFITGQQTWSSNSSGGASLDLFAGVASGSASTSYWGLNCKGQSP